MTKKSGKKLLADCAIILIDKDVNISFAESATAGNVMKDFSLQESAGQFLKGGLVCYDAGVKEEFLNVSRELVEKYTPESAEVTEAAAKGLRDFIESDIHVAVTGLTAPGGSETKDKPVGTVFTHILFKNKSIPDRVVFTGSPEEIMQQTSYRIARLLIEMLGSG